MKRSNIPFVNKGSIILTDGSTLNIDFLYKKDDLFLNPDLRSNPLWLPESTTNSLESLEHKSNKFKQYEFSFESLLEKEQQD